MTLDTEQIQQIMDPHIARLSRAIWPTWDRYVKNIPESERACFDSSCEAHILHCLMANGVRSEFVDVPGVAFLEKYKFSMGIEGFPRVDGMVVCRFKRLNEVGQSRTFPTDRSQKIESNDDEIDGWPAGATFLDIGYVMNEMGMGYREVQVIRVAGVEFIMSIPRVSDSSIQMPIPLFGDGDQPRSRFEMIRPGETETGSGQR